MSFVGWSTSSHVKNASYFKLASNEEGVAFNPLPFLQKAIYFLFIQKYINTCVEKLDQSLYFSSKGYVNLVTSNLGTALAGAFRPLPSKWIQCLSQLFRLESKLLL